jgi:hypothetical protein
MYWFAHDMGAAGPTPPLLRQAQRRIAADPELTAAAVRIFNHDLRPSQVFTSAFSLRTMAQALRRGRGQRRAILREARTIAINEARRRRAAGRPAGAG